MDASVNPAHRVQIVRASREKQWQLLLARATTSTASSRTGRNCRTAGRSRRSAAVGVDNNDNVYVFNRGEHPMMVFDREGNFLRSWGEGQYPRRARRPYGAGRFDLSDR